jgi:hypothetical protein
MISSRLPCQIFLTTVINFQKSGGQWAGAPSRKKLRKGTYRLKLEKFYPKNNVKLTSDNLILIAITKRNK